MAQPSEQAYPPSFYAQDPLTVARQLLGARIEHLHPEHGLIVGRIVETEAYRGQEDLACHAKSGRTPRTETMFGPPGHAYVYLIYGMYHMLNAVAWPDGEPAAVLIRAIEPLQGISRTTNGPGRLTQALHVTREHNGLSLSESGPLAIYPQPPIPEAAIEKGPRIGVDYAKEWALKPWRFWIAGNPHVSR